MRIRDSRSGQSRERRPGIHYISWAAALAGFFCLAFLPSSAGQILQQEQPIHSSSGLPPPNPLANPKPDANQVMQGEMQRSNVMHRIEQLNLLRQKEMTDETTRLLQLAKELRSSTTNAASLSAFDLNKAEAIEKLARSVREKMQFTLSR